MPIEEMKSGRSARRFERAVILLGMILVAAVGFYTLRLESKQMRTQLSSTISYVKGQCMTYTRYNAASVTKSLMRAIENAQQVNRNIGYEGKEPDAAQLEFYTQEQRLTGIMLLDADSTLRCEYNGDSLNFESLQEYIERAAVLDVTRYPQKTYAARVDLPDGSYVDIAAYGRTDCDGVVVVYYHTTAEYAHNYTLTLQGTLSGYSPSSGGVVVVTNGDRIIASNDASLVDTGADDSSILQQIKARVVSGTVSHIQSRDGSYFGSLDRSREYYIYAYVPDRPVIADMLKNMMAALIIYLIVLTAIQMFRRRSAMEYRAEQKRRDDAYREKLMESAERAEQANRAKTEFLQRMSHDIRTPINGIRGMIEIADYYKDDPAKQDECRRKIWDASGLLLELVNEVLDMGKLESGEIMLEEREMDIVELLEGIGTVIERQARERGIRIKTNGYPLEHRWVLGSPLHIKRLVMNIVSNAVKYNRENGRIDLTARELQQPDENTVLLEFTCTDTGIGMSPEFQKHVFEPFAQEGHHARSEYGGTGLGMPIAKTLAEKMGGTLSFTSEKDVGTTFTLTLPFRICDAPAAEEEHEAADYTNVLAGLRVLVAEDNRLNMEIAQFILDIVGAEMLKAVNGKEAVEIFEKSQPGEIDVILMDVMMPVMDGLEAARRIRAMKRPDASTVPLIAMTANAFTEDRRRAFMVGMNMHLAKPLEAQEVIRTLAKFIERSARLDDEK